MLKLIHPSDRYGKKLYSFSEKLRMVGKLSTGALENIDKFLPDIMDVTNFLLKDDYSSSLDRVTYLEPLSYGDANVLLSMPGPSLSGLYFRVSKNKKMIKRFFDDINFYKERSFFALTEPEAGSSIADLKTSYQLISGRYKINGAKCFIGNGMKAKFGIIFAKNKSLINAFYIDKSKYSSHEIHAEELATYSLKGASLAKINFNDLWVGKETLVHSLKNKFALLDISCCFNLYRCGLVAMFLGQVQAFIDHLLDHMGLNQFLKASQEKINILREYLRALAIKSDANMYDPVPGSVAKFTIYPKLLSILEQLYASTSLEYLLTEPLLMRIYRDRFCWEFMEGTGFTQGKIIFSNKNKIFSGC